MTSTTATEDDAPPAPNDDAGEHLWSPLLTIAVSAIVIFLLGIFVSSRLAWPVAFARSALRLVTEPSIGGLWQVPSGLAIALPVLAIVAVQGWLAAKLLLAGSDLERDLALVSGLAITIAISILGLGGTLALVAGRLARLELLVVYAATGIGLGSLTLRRRGLDARTLRRRGLDAVLELRRR
ncbi:MAG TPA: hypothetical protein VEC15_13985, partial [Actinomycetota bacterium]|nr:hypothetical protein [Actinomycetota bacterium]